VCLLIRCLETGSSIVARIFIAAGMCLPSRCLVMDVYSGFTIRLTGVMSQYPLTSARYHSMDVNSCCIWNIQHKLIFGLKIDFLYVDLSVSWMILHKLYSYLFSHLFLYCLFSDTFKNWYYTATQLMLLYFANSSLQNLNMAPAQYSFEDNQKSSVHIFKFIYL
jgi:hypothetical protein